MEPGNTHRVLRADFDISHVRWDDIRPVDPVPTFVLFGRSNVGKSTFIGQMMNRPKLIRASRTPGRTIELLRFLSDWEEVGADGEKHVRKAYVIDTPGYGYAERSKKDIERCSQILQETGGYPPAAGCAVFLWDIRRTPKDDDVALLKSLTESWPQVVLVLTKADKLNKSKGRAARERLGKIFGVRAICSSSDKTVALNAVEHVARCGFAVV